MTMYGTAASSKASATFSSRCSNIQHGRQPDIDINTIKGIPQREDSKEPNLQRMPGPDFPELLEIPPHRPPVRSIAFSQSSVGLDLT
jgi:hypothetical protein